PGCGPQIIVTTLYVNGLIPMSAQMGNALSNDGDALFPAMALAPKAAVVATAYSAVPALIVAYSWYGLLE
ncbi:MAG: putative manganese transporter, partial [Pseudomonadota bacterium]